MGPEAVSILSLSDPRNLEKQLSVAANIPLNLVCSKLSSDTARHNRSWRGRRKALGRMVSALQLGPSNKADSLVFPQQRLSLTHSGDWSIAAGTRSLKILGIGIDFEVARDMDKATTRLFMNQHERNRLGDVNGQALRLWTIKEAVFKADPDNNDYRVSNYELRNPSAHAGWAFRADCNKRFYYISLSLIEGSLAIALCTGRNSL